MMMTMLMMIAMMIDFKVKDNNDDNKDPKVKDRTDGKLVHLDGLNFSRAWGLYRFPLNQKYTNSNRFSQNQKYTNSNNSS